MTLLQAAGAAGFVAPEDGTAGDEGVGLSSEGGRPSVYNAVPIGLFLPCLSG